MQPQRRLTPQEARKFMHEHAQERAEQERNKPADQQHAGVDWVSEYWRERVLS